MRKLDIQSVGTNATLHELNKRFWIIKVRKVLRSVKRQCMKCKIINAKVTQPQTAPIPNFRTAKPLQAFVMVGIDFTGPFLTKSGRGRARFTRYLALFTCFKREQST